MLGTKYEMSGKRFFNILEAMTLIAVMCLTISYFGGYYLIITTIGHHSRLLDKIAFGLLLCKVVLTRYEKREFFIVLSLGGLAIVNYMASGNTDAIMNVLMLSSLKNVDLKKVFKVSLFSLIFIVSLVGILSVAGIAGDVSMTEYFRKMVGIETRFCFGFSHPNQWAHAMFMIFLFMALAYWESMSWAKIFIIAVGSYVVYHYSGSRAGLLVGIVLILLLIMYHYGSKIMNTIVMKVLTFLGLLGSWVVPLVCMADTKLSEILIDTFHIVFTGRLTYAKQFCKYYGITLWGKKLETYLTVEEFQNIVLDLGHIRFLLENGVILFLVWIVFLFILAVYALKKNEGKVLVGIICITLYSFNESIAIARIPANIIIYFFAYFVFKNSLLKSENVKEELV